MIMLASTRGNIATCVSALFTVYIALIFIYILLNLLLSFGVRIPYSRWSDMLMNFLREVCDPYLRLFRRRLPSVGGFDFTPIIAILLLYVAQSLIPGWIQG
jgi:YggT family protein